MTYPIGVYAKSDCFRCLSTTYDEAFILERMKASRNNIKPVVIIDDTTMNITVKIPNQTLTRLIDTTAYPALAVKYHQTAEWQIRRTSIQKSSTINNLDKERACTLIYRKYHQKRTLTRIQKDQLTEITNRS